MFFQFSMKSTKPPLTWLVSVIPVLPWEWISAHMGGISAQTHPNQQQVLLVPTAHWFALLVSRRRTLLFCQEIGWKAAPRPGLSTQLTAQLRYVWANWYFCSLLYGHIHSVKVSFLEGRVSHEYNPCLSEKHCHYLLLKMILSISLLCILIMTR